jgi:hypothetical protein
MTMNDRDYELAAEASLTHDALYTYPQESWAEKWLSRAIFGEVPDYDGARRAMARMASAPRSQADAARDRRRRATMDRIAADDTAARYAAGRRADARKNGYRGPLTRAEASAQQLARVTGR